MAPKEYDSILCAAYQEWADAGGMENELQTEMIDRLSNEHNFPFQVSDLQAMRNRLGIRARFTRGGHARDEDEDYISSVPSPDPEPSPLSLTSFPQQYFSLGNMFELVGLYRDQMTLCDGQGQEWDLRRIHLHPRNQPVLPYDAEDRQNSQIFPVMAGTPRRSRAADASGKPERTMAYALTVRKFTNTDLHKAMGAVGDRDVCKAWNGAAQKLAQQGRLVRPDGAPTGVYQLPG